MFGGSYEADDGICTVLLFHGDAGDARAPQPFLGVPSFGIMHDYRLLSVLLR